MALETLKKVQLRHPDPKDGAPDRRRSLSSVPEDVKKRIRSVMWYVTTVALDLEARGEIERVPGSKPQRPRRR
jgi:hypothetical protein